MRRRDFITLIGSAALASPLVAHAQERKVIRIGMMGASLLSAPPIAYFKAFVAGLAEHGFVEGKNIRIEYRGIDDPGGPFAGAAQLMRSEPDMLVATGPEVLLQAMVGASRAVPIVFAAVNYDPLERGYVASLARPGGNITGVYFRPIELASKQLEILVEAFPDRTKLAVLSDRQSADQVAAAESVVAKSKVGLLHHRFEKLPYDFETAFRDVMARGAQMMLVLSGPSFTQYREQIGQIAMAHKLPTMFTFKHYVEAGGLMSYGVDFIPMYRRAAAQAARILNGTKPAELPVEQASTFEMAVSLKTAKAIGVTLPTSILLRADAVIE